MLHWVGKKPLDAVKPFPAQLCEVYRVQTPPSSPGWEALEKNWCNLLFHGDNKEILSTLLVHGFRGKIDLIYIDPPFDSGANYVRRVALRGNRAKVLEGQGYTTLEDIQYEDIWANDTYLQYMYERLILLKELLSERGSIYLHCDYRKSHHLRFLMDEIFGEANFRNEIVWCYTGPSKRAKYFPRKHDVILLFKKGVAAIFNEDEIRIPYKKTRTGTSKNSSFLQEDYQMDQRGKVPEDWWEISPVGRILQEICDYPTQKPEALLERIIKASSNPDAIVLDCFCGSGTTAAVAEKLGRRWIAADLNKGALQTTIKRLQRIALARESNGARHEAAYGFAHYRVNNYDFKAQRGLRELIIEKYGIEITHRDLFFDGLRNQQLVKIAELHRPLTPHDIHAIYEELSNRPGEARAILLIGNGSEAAVYREAHERSHISMINKLQVIDIQRDGCITFTPASAQVRFEKQGTTMQVYIENYLSPTILRRLARDRSVFEEDLGDFRAQIDCVMLDADYDGKVFQITQSDLPVHKTQLITGAYTLQLPRPQASVAVKIVDLLGEEVWAFSTEPSRR